MKTLLHGLDPFKARGLQDKRHRHVDQPRRRRPEPQLRNVPHIIWGNGGGYLKQGQYIDAGNVTNNKLFNTLITAAIRDKSTAAVNFGTGTGTARSRRSKA